MKTAHEILQEGNFARLRLRAEERKWLELKRQCQSPTLLMFTWLGIFLFVTLIGGLWQKSHPIDWKGLPFVPLATLLLMVPAAFIGYSRRQKALLKIIEVEAPQLFQKLRDEGIV